MTLQLRRAIYTYAVRRYQTVDSHIYFFYCLLFLFSFLFGPSWHKRAYRTSSLWASMAFSSLFARQEFPLCPAVNLWCPPLLPLNPRRRKTCWFPLTIRNSIRGASRTWKIRELFQLHQRAGHWKSEHSRLLTGGCFQALCVQSIVSIAWQRLGKDPERQRPQHPGSTRWSGHCFKYRINFLAFTQKYCSLGRLRVDEVGGGVLEVTVWFPISKFKTLPVSIFQTLKGIENPKAKQQQAILHVTVDFPVLGIQCSNFSHLLP